MAVDPLEVAQDVEMQGRSLQALAQPALQALVMAFRGGALEVAEMVLLHQQLAGKLPLACDEDAGCQLQIVLHPGGQPPDFPEAVVGRSEERRGGKEGVSTCRYRWTRNH